MRRLLLTLYWLVVLGHNEENIVLEFRDVGTCSFYMRLYMRVGLPVVTNCNDKGGDGGAKEPDSKGWEQGQSA